MRITEMIQSKKVGGQLSEEQIHSLLRGYARGCVPEHQMAALIMAVWFNGLSRRETIEFTRAMAESGDSIPPGSFLPCSSADKHSTGGVGDKTTLVLGPLLAAAGVIVAKMSGRSLGHTGGTIDKLESIPGLSVHLSLEELVSKAGSIGLAVGIQTENLVPADQKLYTLRDATATVDSLPLIASSIMSKKLACSADTLLLDVKVGEGALLPEIADAQELASMMVEIGNSAGQRTRAAITDMNQPLGCTIGNALEVTEAIDTLRGRGSSQLRHLCLFLGSHVLALCDDDTEPEENYRNLASLLSGGEALDKFSEFIENQGGDPRITEDTSLLPQAEEMVEVRSRKCGCVCGIRTSEIGAAAQKLSAGRDASGQVRDPAAGIVLQKKIADEVQCNELLATLHRGSTADARIPPQLIDRVRSAFCIGETRILPPQLIRALVTDEGITHLKDHCVDNSVG